MSAGMSESAIEDFAIKLFERLGYPPDMQLLATETVLKQAEMIANELAVHP
jgi:hypothetical protein